VISLEQEILVSYYDSLYETKQKNYKTVLEIIDIIKSEKLKHHTDYLRQERVKEKRDNYKKDNLPGVIFQGKFYARANNKIFQASGLTTIDIDEYDGDINKIKQEVIKEKNVFLVFVSPSGALKLVIKTPIIENDEDYKIMYSQLLEYFKKFSPATDEKTKDISRFCFLSYDPDLYYNPNAEEFEYDPTLNIINNTSGKFKYEDILDGVQQGNRDDAAFKLACRYKGKRLEQKETLMMVQTWNQTNNPPLSIKEIEKCVESAYKYEGINKTLNKENDVKNEVITQLLFKKNREATEIIVNYILNKEYIYTTRDDEHSEMWIYREGIYVPQGKTYLKELIREILGDGYTTYLTNEVINKIESETYIEQDTFFNIKYKNKIAVMNGILILSEGKLEPFNPKEIYFNKLPIKYDKTKDCPTIKKHFENVLHHKEDIPVLQELFGYLLYKDYCIEKAFMFTGNGRNGKGKTLELMKRFLGIDNCSNIPLQQIETDNFALGEFFNKLANLGGDISSNALKDTGAFKNLTGRDLISASRKFKTRVNFTNYAKLIFCANELPITYDITPAFFNRWVLLNFPHTFISEQEINKMDESERKNYKIADKNIIDRLSDKDELSGLLNWALEGIKRLLEQEDFSYSKSISEVKSQWLRLSNSATAFVMDELEEQYGFLIPKEKFRYKYSEYCKKNRLKPVGDKTLKNMLLINYGVWETKKTYEGELTNCWEGLKFKQGDICEEFIE